MSSWLPWWIGLGVLVAVVILREPTRDALEKSWWAFRSLMWDIRNALRFTWWHRHARRRP